jgi:hypothetical protein
MYMNTIKVVVTSSRKHKKEVVVTFFRYNWRASSEPKAKLCVDARMTSLGNFYMIPQSTPFT